MKNERKTGWATITHKDGSSVTGEIKVWHGDWPAVRMLGETWSFIVENATITYIDPPMPALPTKQGSVIEAGDGMRFFLVEKVDDVPWIASKEIGGFAYYSDEDLITYCRENGGFTIILEGKEPN